MFFSVKFWLNLKLLIFNFKSTFQSDETFPLSLMLQTNKLARLLLASLFILAKHLWLPPINHYCTWKVPERTNTLAYLSGLWDKKTSGNIFSLWKGNFVGNFVWELPKVPNNLFFNAPSPFVSCLLSNHRYRKSLNRLLKVSYVPATSAVLIAFVSSFVAAAINSTNEANKIAGTRR
jgi:hypothetical protein